MNETKSLKLKKILIAVLSVIFSVCLILSLNGLNNSTVKAEKISIPEEIVFDEYTLGSKVDFPTSISVEFQGQTLTATRGYVVFPDNTAVSAGSLSLNKLGEYVINYLFDFGGQTHVAQKRFIVTDKLYSLSTDGGSITPISASSQQDKVYEDGSSMVLSGKSDGLIVKLADKNTFNYTTSIDLTDVNENGLCDIITIDYNLSNFTLNPDYVEGETANWKKYYPNGESAKYCVVRLTDSYDPANYVELFFYADFPIVGYPEQFNPDFDFLKDSTYPSTYKGMFTARAVGQKRTGAILWNPTSHNEWGGFKKVNIGGADYGVYIDNRLGLHSSLSLGQSLTQDHTPYTWQYDYKTNNIYLKTGNKTALVTSLSNSDLYGDKVFNGFSKDMVKVSVYMSDYLTDSQGRVDIFSIGKDDGESLVQNFDKSGFIDNVAVPYVDIDLENTDEYGIYAPVGYTFNLPEATVLGGEHAKSYQVNAYVNYGTEFVTNVPIVNGQIKIDRNAQYAIRYTAKNGAGGVGEKFIYVNAKSGVNNAISLNTEYDFTQVEAGDNNLYLPEYSVSTINREDMVKVEIKAVHNKETVIIDAESRKFLPSYAGEYKIIYKISDNVFTANKEFTLNCVPSDRVGFAEKMNLPKFLVKNAVYSFDYIKAYSFNSSEPKEISVNAFISFDGGAFNAISNMNSVAITGNSTAVIKFTCKNGSAQEEISSSEIRIVDIDYFNEYSLVMKNLFVHDGFTVKPYDWEDLTSSYEVKYDSNTGSGNGKLEYINAIDLSRLKLGFKTPRLEANYSSIKITLTDYYDVDNVLTVEYINGDPWCLVEMNGKNRIRSGFAFADDNVSKVLRYDSAIKKLTVNDATYDVDFSEYFTSKLGYLTIELCGMKGNSSIIMSELNLQGFSNDLSWSPDQNAPLISIDDYSGEYLKGTVIEIKAPTVTDVITPIVKSKVSLKVTKDGKVITAVDGTKLDGNCDPFKDYKIKLTQMGRYDFTYTAVDGFGNEVIETRFVTVVDGGAPIIKFVKNYTDQGIEIQEGETVDVSVSVSDDITPAKELKTSVIVRDLTSGACYTYNDYKLKFGYAGEFEIVVTTQDSTGNYSSAKLKVVVVKEGGNV